MMKTQTITIDILADGTISVNVEGVEGKKCLDLTKGFEEKLGSNIERKMKDNTYNSNFFISKKVEINK